MEGNRKGTGVVIAKGVALVLLAFVLYVSLFPAKQEYANWDSSIHTQVVKADGTVTEYSDNVWTTMNKGDHATLTVELPADKRIDNATLRFCAYCCTVSAEFDGKTLYTYGQDIADRGDMIGAVYPSILIPDDAWGKSITINLDFTEDNAMSRVQVFEMWPADQAYRYHLDGNIFNMCITIAGCVLGLICLGIALISHVERTLRLCATMLSMFTFTSSLGLLCNSGIIRLFTEEYFWDPLQYVMLYAATVLLLGYLLLVQKNKVLQRVLAVLLCVSTLFLLATTIMNAVNFLHFPATLRAGHVMLVVVAVTVVVTGFINARDGMLQSRLFLMGIAMAMLVGLFDIFRFNIIKTMSPVDGFELPSVLTFALMIFVVFFVLSFNSEAETERERRRQSEEETNRLQAELVQTRVRVMMSQMQPHFLYNALSSIRAIVKVNPDYAYDLLYDFTVHLRSTIRSLSSDDLIPFEKEKANIEAYLNIERMRFGEELQVIYEIECDDFDVVPLSFQPFVENATRHGLQPKRNKGGGTIIIRTYREKGAVIVEVEDDGVGFEVEDTLAKETDSVGLKNSIFRLESLLSATVTIDSTIGKGTLVRVRIPAKGKPEAIG